MQTYIVTREVVKTQTIKIKAPTKEQAIQDLDQINHRYWNDNNDQNYKLISITNK